MAKENLKKFEETETHQAVCTRGDFFGKRQEDPGAAEIDAARHNAQPGKANHVVKIITTTKKVRDV